ncbi:hypothetical protein DOTSEDRAFT_42274 [Dothistroma septosporum NZE10]|uniref:Uncharacterized protein n=1 Tax=Dothistroma septosporum (strain NZE10 / CBS 128990) TaxID=675120 RepID=N1PX33_DOTSN|nr:hypothetical protein DOTSEDRAFT_42274 [Dothistroma septosporum NZE10]
MIRCVVGEKPKSNGRYIAAFAITTDGNAGDEGRYGWSVQSMIDVLSGGAIFVAFCSSILLLNIVRVLW